MDNNPEMGKFVIFDDDCYELRDVFPHNLVCCPNRLEENEYRKAINIFEY